MSNDINVTWRATYYTLPRTSTNATQDVISHVKIVKMPLPYREKE